MNRNLKNFLVLAIWITTIVFWMKIIYTSDVI